MSTAGKQIINIGNQSNDGTGDSIRDAFSKTNGNFDLLFAASGLGSGLRFTSLVDAPKALSPERVIVSDSAGLTLTQLSLVGGTGISIGYNYGSGQLVITNTSSALSTDTAPTLSADLNGNNYRAKGFADPQRDRDLVTRKWLYDNFLNRDSNYVSDAGDPAADIIVSEGSTLRHNTQISLTTASASFNIGKTITVFTASGSTSTIDLAQQGILPGHLTRKDYVDTKISLQGIDTIDPATGLANAGFGQMTGALYLARDPVDSDGGLIAATKHYVDNNGYYSSNNLYVTMKGRDNQPDIPAYKRGRFYGYAFASLNKAAQYAEQIIDTSRIEVGDYARPITYSSGTACTVHSVTDNYGNTGLTRVVLNTPGVAGSDQFGAVYGTGKFTIYPGQYVQGATSNAIGLIEAISTGTGGLENYDIAYVDYAVNFNSTVTTTSLGNDQIRFTVQNTELVPIPDFWVGYQFYIDSVDIGGNISITNQGTILSIASTASTSGIYYDTFVVQFPTGTAPGNGQTYSSDRWHVYSGDFSQGESLIYNTNVSSMQISFIVESGEYYEQYPIKLAANTSIRGDEFRRVIFRPANGLSKSKWATTYFRRDTQVDGLQVTPYNTSTNYATTGTLVGATATPSGSSGDIIVTLSTGSISSSYKNYMFIGNGGQGVITACNGTSFSVTVDNNGMTNSSPMAPSNWAIYKPINFGYHYLRDPSKPINVLTTQTNLGGYYAAANLLLASSATIASQVISYLTTTFTNYVFDHVLYAQNAANIVTSVANDLIEGGGGDTVINADYISKIPGLAANSTCTAGISYINTLAQPIIAGLRDGSSVIVADLIQAAARIVNLDPAFNPPKDNADMDVFLMNDATIIRYVSCQNHGGFMKVLDPAGQIKNKSPYTQTASSFSQSKAKQAFRGGMFVDGFAGNLQVNPTTSTFSNPLQIPVKGLVRKPQVPTFFINNGIRYEVDFFSHFAADPSNTGTYVATLNLNPLTPGGIPVTGTNIVTVTDTAQQFKPNQTNIPITVDTPAGVGGIVATGYATSNSSGNISNVVITFPGTGYLTTPKISLGGAVINNLQINNGHVTTASITSVGGGYTTATVIKFIPVNAAGVTTATAIVSSVDSNGGILGFTVTNSGTNWTAATTYSVQYGNAQINVRIVPGFVDAVPTIFELITAGNRSMLANDFTQINDLGYGILVTNGGFMENVSMFTYYCYRSYYALNGSQVRSTTGSSCYGKYGLCAEGSDPNEVPISVKLSYPLTQIATAYVNGSLFPAAVGQTSIYVTVNSANGGYPALGSSQIEINHNGIIKTYSIGAASPALDSNNNVIPNVYQLTFNSGNINSTGLLTAVSNGTPVTIRVEGLNKFYGVNPATLSRSSTVLTMDDDPTEVYHVTGYSAVQPDNAVFIYTLENYNYIALQAQDQGVTYPKITNAGTGYTTATVSITSATVTSTYHTVYGDQGSAIAGVQVLKLFGVQNVVVGQLVSGTGITDGTVVTYVNTVTTQIGLSIATPGIVTSSTGLTFTGIAPAAHAVISSGAVSVVVDNSGAGWNSTATTITITPSGGSNFAYSSTLTLAGVIGSRTIKVAPLDLLNQDRIYAGLGATPVRYYQFGYNGQLFNITAYRPTSVTEQSWAEIDIDQPLQLAVSKGSTLYAGVSSSGGGKIYTRLSLLRATGHDFVDIGTGGYADTRIPNDLYGPPINAPQQLNEVTEKGPARVYYATTDQDGNFRVGKAFTVNQAQGSVSINAPIDLANLSSISLKRDLGVPVNEFSTDNTMITQADYKVPTEQAVAHYIDRRLGLNRDGNATDLSLLSGGGFVAVNGKMVMKGSLDLGSNNIINVAGPRLNSIYDAANKGYVDARISKSGTGSKDVDNVTDASTWGLMTGPLQLVGDPTTITTTTVATANLGTYSIPLASVFGTYLDLQVNGPGIPAGTVVQGFDFSLKYIILSNATTQSIPAGTVLTLDPVYQAATKGYVDKRKQFNQLRDVAITSPANQDLVMFSSTVLTPQASSGTTEAIYNTATQIVNVAVTANSDVSFTRSGNTVRTAVVANTITNAQINSNAAIAYSKLNLSNSIVNADIASGAAIANSKLANSSVTVTAGTGISGGGTVSLGGTIAMTNTGILSITGTSNQVIVSAGQNPTLSLPQSIGTSSTPTFADVTVTNLRAASGGGTVYGTWILGASASFQATYADLAEWYASDIEYDPGTVLVFGGSAEVTTSNVYGDSSVAGVVTTNPAYVLNQGLEGVRSCIALQGRVPVNVIGKVKKGDLLTTSTTPGYACKAVNPQVGTIIGKALADKDTEESGSIEVAIGRN